MKPGVVMFGENVPMQVVEHAFNLVDRSDGIVAAGTSLMVYSVFRFIRRAAELAIPIAIVNVGPTRGDDLAHLKVPALTGAVFGRLTHTVARPAATALQPPLAAAVSSR